MRNTSDYMIDGVRLPSVTEILAEVGFDANLSSVDDATLLAAGDRGTLVHNWTELLDQGEEFEPTGEPEIDQRVAAYQAFRREHPFELVEYELAVIHPGCKYAGTLDRVFRDADGVVWVCDLKTALGSPIERNRSALQVTAYALAYREVAQLDRNPRGLVVWLRPDGKYQMHRVQVLEKLWESCLTIHYLRAGTIRLF